MPQPGTVAILAVDVGTRTGWALWDGYRVESGVQTFPLGRGDSPGMRFMLFNRWLETMALRDGSPRVGVMVYERAHHRGGAATELAVGMQTRIQEFAARHGIQVRGEHTATIKKHATGRGNADKHDMLVAAATAFEFSGDDDNEADALWLLDYARRHYGGD